MIIYSTSSKAVPQGGVSFEIADFNLLETRGEGSTFYYSYADEFHSSSETFGELTTFVTSSYQMFVIAPYNYGGFWHLTACVLSHRMNSAIRKSMYRMTTSVTVVAWAVWAFRMLTWSERKEGFLHSTEMPQEFTEHSSQTSDHMQDKQLTDSCVIKMTHLSSPVPVMCSSEAVPTAHEESRRAQEYILFPTSDNDCPIQNWLLTCGACLEVILDALNSCSGRLSDSYHPRLPCPLKGDI